MGRNQIPLSFAGFAATQSAGHRSDQLRAVIGIEAHTATADPGAPFQLGHQSAMSPASREHTYAGDIYHLCTISPSTNCADTHSLRGPREPPAGSAAGERWVCGSISVRRPEHTPPLSLALDRHTNTYILPMWCYCRRRICSSAIAKEIDWAGK